MSKVNTTTDIKSAQNIVENSPLDPSRTVDDIMDSIYGPAVKPEDYEGDYGVSQVPQAAPIDPRPTGFNDQDQMIPMWGPEGRFNNVKQGVARPEFDQWQGQGMQVEAPPTPAQISQSMARPSYNADPLTDTMARAKKTASMMDITDTKTPNITVSGTGPSPQAKQEQVDLNRRIALEQDEATADRLRKERARKAAIDHKDNKRENSLNMVYNKIGALEEKQSPYQADVIGAYPSQKFLATGAIATEHALDQAFMGTSEDGEFYFRGDEFVEEDEQQSSNLVNPSQLADTVGREIVKWWGSEKEAEGKPINTNLSAQERKDVGGAHLLAYARANPELVNIVKTSRDERGEYIKDENGHAIRFELTPLGQVVFENNRRFRDEALSHIIDPESTPQPSGLKGAKADVRPAFRNRKFSEGNGDPAYATMEQVDESIGNQNSVAHVVDDRRVRIALTMLIPALFSPIGKSGDRFADAFDIGEVSLQTIKNNKQMNDGMDENAAIDEAIKITGKKKQNLAQSIMTAILFRGRPNYLTYAMQPLTGRTMAQQSKFNPTSNKLIRFVTRSKHPAKVTKGSKTEDNFLNIMALSFGKDDLLGEGRIKDIKDNHATYYKWGDILEGALEATLPQAAFEAAVEMLSKGGKLPPELAKGLEAFQRTIAGKDSALYDLLGKKGEDAPMAIDALIDYKRYSDAREKGMPHFTFVNAYVDGKTNGLANQGLMLGIRKIAAKVGALRSDGATHAVEGGDIRDEMKSIITNRIQQGGLQKAAPFEGDTVKYTDAMEILEMLAGEREINKKISMIFPYGKEIGGMKGEIRKLLPAVMASNGKLSKKLRSYEKKYGAINDIVDMAHDNVVYALFEIFGEDTFKAKGLMRSVGFMHAVADQLFSIRGPAGMRLMLGDYRFDPEKQTKSVVKVSQKDRGQNVIHLQDTSRYASSAAARDGKAAGWARGRASVTPTQAIDAATVIRSSSGRSWGRQVDAHPAGEPYFLQVYDAYKVDANTFDVLVDEVNRNFLDITTRDWSFINEALKELTRLDNYVEKISDLAANRVVSFKRGRMDYLYQLLDPMYILVDGEHVPTRRVLKDFLRAAEPINPDMNYDGKVGAVPAEKVQIPSEKMAAYEAWITKRASIVNLRLVEAFNEGSNADVKPLKSGTDFIDSSRNPMEINGRQVKLMYDVLMDETKLFDILSQFKGKTDRARAALRSEIRNKERRTGAKVAQFWAH